MSPKLRLTQVRTILILIGMGIVGFYPQVHAFIANPVQWFNTGLWFENIGTSVDDFALDSIGRIIITSSQQSSYGSNVSHGIVRIGSNGGFDGTFNPGGIWLDGYTNKILQTPEWLYIGNPGWVTNWYNSVPIRWLIRLNNGWNLDTSFQVAANTFSWMDFSVLTRQSDGKILTVWNYFDTALSRTRFFLKRINTDGTVDTTFTQSEYLSPSYNGVTSVIQTTDGGILVGGSFTGVSINNIVTNTPQLIKLLPDGTIDTNFSIGTRLFYSSCTTFQIPTIKSIVEDGSGNIIFWGNFNAIQTAIGTQFRTAVARISSTWWVDTSFNPNSWPACNVSVESIIIEGDGRILLGGDSTVTSYGWLPTGPIFRLTATGGYDGSFQTTLTGTTGYSVKKMILQPNGRILVTGNVDNSARIVRFNTDGTRDFSLTESETHSFAFGFEMASDFDANGNILVVWDFTRYNNQSATWIARIRPNGQLDSSLNTWTGFQWWSAVGIQVENDGNILIYGNLDTTNYRGTTLSWCIIRVDPSWNLLDNFSNFELGMGYCGTNFGTRNPLQIQNDGRIVVAGLAGGVGSWNNLIRLTQSGTIDTIFDTSWYDIFNIRSFQILPDYSLLAFGDFDMYVWGNLVRHHVLRYFPNGLRDYSINMAPFMYGTWTEGEVIGGVLDGSGNMNITGYFRTYGGNPSQKWFVNVSGSWVYNSNFSYITSSPTGGIIPSTPYLFARGNIAFIEHDWQSYFSTRQLRILHTSGSIDTSIYMGTGIYGAPGKIYEAPNGNILLLGMMQTYLGNGSYHHSILLLEDKPAAIDLLDSFDTGNSQTDNITRNVFPLFSWTGCLVGDTITLHQDYSDAIIGTTNCNTDATYQIKPTEALTDGTYIMTVRFRSNGNVSKHSNPLTITIDSSAATFSFTTGSILTNDTTPQLTGIGESGSTILLTVNGNVYTTNVIGSGTWALTISNTLSDGTYTTTAYQTDIGGTVSAPISNTIIIDSTPPDAPIVSYPPNNITLGNANPYFAGTTESWAIIRATINGSTYQATLSWDVTTWNFQATNPLSNGANTVIVRAQDLAGNISTGTTLTINLDPSIWDAPIVIYPWQWETLNINNPTILGIGGSGDPSLVTIGILDSIEYPVSESLTGWQFTPGQLSEGIHTLVIQQKDAEWNILSQRLWNFNIDTIAPSSPTLTSPINKTITKSWYTAYEVSGNCENDTSILITGTMNGNTNCINSIWKYLFNFTSIPDGNISVQLSWKDAAGNISTGTTYSFIKDITAPTISLSSIYTPASSTLSNDGQVLSILVDASETLSGLSLSSFQTSSWIVMKNLSLVSGWTSRWMVDITPMNGSGFEWTLQVSIPANSVTDGNGNPNIASNVFTYQIDTLAPNIPSIVSITKWWSNTVTITGTGQSNMKIFVFDTNNAPLCSSNVTPSGTWGCSFYYVSGNQTIKVIQQDASNNTSVPLSYTFDLSWDGPTFSLTPNIDQSKIITGSVSISIQPSVPLMNPLTQTGISITNGTLTSLTQSGNTYTAIIARGNTSSGILTFQIPANAVTDFGGRKNLASEKLSWYHQSANLAATQTGSKWVANLATDISYSDAGNGNINVLVYFSNHSDTLLEKWVLTIQLDEKTIFWSGNSSQGIGIYNAVKHTYTVDLWRIYPYTYGTVNIGTTLNGEVVIERWELTTVASIQWYDATWRSGLEADGSDNSKTKKYSFTPTSVTASYLSGTYVYSGNTNIGIENINQCSLEKKVSKESILATDIANHWAKENIEQLIEYWIVKNLSLFRPEDKITRAEFITLIVRSLRCSYSLEELEDTRSTFFRDVTPNAWYSNYVWLAEKNSWIPSDIISYFRPDDAITRAEAISMVISALGATDTSEATGFSDIGGLSEYQQNLILTAQSLWIVNGVTGWGKTYFLPYNKLSRAEWAKMIQRAFLQDTIPAE